MLKRRYAPIFLYFYDNLPAHRFYLNSTRFVSPQQFVFEHIWLELVIYIINTFLNLHKFVNSNNNKLFNDTARLLTTTTPLHHHWLYFYYWRQGTNITTPKQPRYIAAAVTFIPSAITINAVDIYTFTKLSAMTRWRDKLYQSHSDAEDQTENNTSILTDEQNVKVYAYPLLCLNVWVRVTHIELTRAWWLLALV